jgi:hypothetical protein
MARHAEETWLDAAVPLALHGADRRSQVWLARSPKLGKVVVKRYEGAPWRQRLVSLAQLHPAQRERRASRLLAARGIPVLPVIEVAAKRTWHGDRYWLARPLWGKTLDRWLAHQTHLTWDTRRRLTHNLARILSRLMDLGLMFPGLSTSNLVANAEGQVWLIDVVSVRRGLSLRGRRAMLAALDAAAAAHGASRSDRLRCLRQVVAVHHELGNLRDAARAIARLRARR